MNIGKGKERYLFGYPREDGEEELREMTLGRFARDKVFVSDPGEAIHVLHRANETIWHVWKRFEDRAGNIVWKPQDIEEFANMAEEYRRSFVAPNTKTEYRK